MQTKKTRVLLYSCWVIHWFSHIECRYNQDQRKNCIKKWLVNIQSKSWSQAFLLALRCKINVLNESKNTDHQYYHYHIYNKKDSVDRLTFGSFFFSIISYQLVPFFMLMYTFQGYSWGNVSSPPKIFEGWLARPQSQVGSGPLNI